MTSYPPLKLSRLRDIGWTEWDPIGLLPAGDVWDDHPEFASEYDSYLIRAASELRRGWSVWDAAEYLLSISSEHMGMGLRPEFAARAEATAMAIKAYVDEPTGP